MTQHSNHIKCSFLAKHAMDTIVRYDMLATGDYILVAVSGGADSTALLNLLYALKSDLNIKLAVAHLNHGLRGRASDNDARFVQILADRLKLPCHCKQIQLKPSSCGSIEEQGRQARYAFFQEVVEQYGYTKIALGHHMNDNAEAVLMHLLRGSGIRGLSGIPPVRDGKIIRPLIDASRAQILHFLERYKILYVEDASNADLRYERNKIRHHLLPLLENQYNINVVATLHRTAGLCRLEEAWFQQYLRPLINQIVSSSDPNVMTLNTHQLANHSRAVQRRLVREALRLWHGNLKRIQIDHVDNVLALMKPQAVGKRICLPNHIGITRTSNRLCFTYRIGRGFSPTFSQTAYSYDIPLPEKQPVVVDLPEIRQQFRFSCRPFCLRNNQKHDLTHTIWLDRDQLTFPLTLRNFHPGDRIQLQGIQGHQKIKKILNAFKIPVHLRPRMPLLLSAGEVLWVVGIRRSALAIPSIQTTSIIAVEVTRTHP